MEKKNYFENEYTQMWIEDEILYLVYKPNLITTINVAKKIVEDRLKISNGLSRPIFLDARNLVSVDRASMKYYKTKESMQHASAGAFLINHPIARFIGNIFLNIDKPPIPAKIFTDKAKALQWLEYYKGIKEQ
jgi:hypothetical protein